jgi:hypothetical protein
MRRCLTLFAVAGLLALAGCSDNSQQAPTEPQIQLDKGVPCPGTVFPLSTAKTQITALYPAGTLRTAALAKAADVAKKWSQCKVADPQSKVVAFVKQLLSDFRSGVLRSYSTPPTTADRVSALINTMYSGVGFGTPNLPVDPTTGTDFGIGFFTPGTPLLVRSNLNDLAVSLGGDAFTETTAITILLRPNTPNPFAGTGQTVLPPFVEITASNLSGTHYLAHGRAVVGLCVDEETLAGLNDPAIAHLAVTEGAHPGGFEVLDEASSTQYDALGLNCEQFVPPEIGSLFEGGLKGFARAAAAAMFLPSRLEAAVGKKGLGGLPTSLSPFGVTDRAPTAANHLTLTNEPDFTHYFKGGVIDACHDGCEPEVQILDDGDHPVGAGTNVTVSLIQTEGTGGVLSGTLTEPIGGTGLSARYGDLRIDQPGTYQLMFSAPGAQPVTSRVFHVYTLAFQTQPTATPDETITPNDFLGETVDGFTNPVVQAKIVDFSGATVTDHTSTIHLSITAGTLNGDTEETDNSGVASFTQLEESSVITQNGLTVNTDGQLLSGLQLEAAVFDEPPVTSAAFNVDGRSF